MVDQLHQILEITGTSICGGIVARVNFNSQISQPVMAIREGGLKADTHACIKVIHIETDSNSAFTIIRKGHT